jgi:hypothetical protein
LIKNGQIIQELIFGKNNAINCIQPLKNGVAVGGEGGFISIYEFNLYDKLEELRSIFVPDPESIITCMTNTISEGTLLVAINTNQILKYSSSALEASKVII